MDALEIVFMALMRMNRDRKRVHDFNNGDIVCL